MKRAHSGLRVAHTAVNEPGNLSNSWLNASHSPLNRAPQIVQNTNPRSFKLNKLEGLTDNCEFVQPMLLHKILKFIKYNKQVKRAKCLSLNSKSTVLSTTVFPLI